MHLIQQQLEEKNAPNNIRINLSKCAGLHVDSSFASQEQLDSMPRSKVLDSLLLFILRVFLVQLICSSFFLPIRIPSFHSVCLHEMFFLV